MNRLLHHLCYRTEHVAHVEFDSTTGTITTPDAHCDLAVKVGYIVSDGKEPLQLAEVTRTTPRVWFKPLHRLKRWLNNG